MKSTSWEGQHGDLTSFRLAVEVLIEVEKVNANQNLID